MTKEYINITILNIKELNIDDSSKADLCCYLYCSSWGENPQQTDVFKNTLSANFLKTFQIPIIDFKTDVVTFKLKDLSKNKVLSSVSIQASRIPPGDGFKVLNLIPESNVKNGGKLEIEFQGKDEEYSDTTEPLIPPILPLSEDSDPSFDNLEKIYKKNHKEPSILTFHPEPESKPNDEYSNYSYYDSNSAKEKNLKHQEKGENQNNEYSYYSTESKKNQKNHRSSIPKPDNQNNIDEYSYYSTNSLQNQGKAKQQNDELNDYEYYSTDPPDPPKPQLNNSSFCDSYNYESSTESPVKPSKSSENLSEISNLNQNSSQNSNDETNSVQKDVSLNNEPRENDSIPQKKSTDTNSKLRKSSKENQNPNKSKSKEPKKVKNAAVVKREKAAPTTAAMKKMIKKEDAAIFSKYFKAKSRNLH